MNEAPARRLAILIDGGTNRDHAKTAAGVVRFSPFKTVAIICPEARGRDPEEWLGAGRGVPVVDTLEEALALRPNSLLLGTAPMGGGLPESWRTVIEKALRAGLDILNGLHVFLSDDPHFSRLARELGRELVDYRKPPENLPVGLARCKTMRETIVLFTGTDCSVGKMTAALVIAESLRAQGLRAEVVATGQTGMMITGRGYAIDAIKGDFMAGAVEKLILELRGKTDIVLVEGQGSLLHPGYSSVTLALLHGAVPDGMTLCHTAGMEELKRDLKIAIPPLDQVAAQYEELARFIKPCKTFAAAVRTAHLSEEDARRAIADTEAILGAPADDPVRFGAGKLADAVMRLHREKQARLAAR